MRGDYLNNLKKILSITGIFLVLTIFFSAAAGSVQAEAALEMSQDPYNLIPSGKAVIPVIGEEDLKKFEIPDNEAMRFVKQLKEYSVKAISVPKIYWCGAKTTKELFRALKTAGFNLVRIPVSWHNHLTDDQYTIDPKWMARVKEVAQWAVD